MSDNNNPRDGRIPKDMKGLLQFCITAGAESNQGADQPNFEVMAPEV